MKTNKYYFLGLLNLFSTLQVNAQIVNQPILTEIVPPGTGTAMTLPPAYSGVPQAKNYVKEWSYQAPITSETTVPTNLQAKQTVTYMDGFGNTIQKIKRAQSATFANKDIVEFSDYRVFGDKKYSFLNYVANGTNLTFRTNPYSEQRTFYNTNYPEENGASYSMTSKSSSTLGAVDNYAPGKSNILQNRYVTSSLQTASKAKIRCDNSGNLTYGGTYSNTEIIVQNTTTSDGHWAQEVKTKTGKLIEKSSSCNNGCMTTRYIYDAFDRLAYEIPPEAYQTISGTWNFSDPVIATAIDKLCWYYKYDDLGRLIEKKSPSKDGKEYFVYDFKDRVVLVQDPNLVGSAKWKFTLYDKLGRNIASGLYLNSSTRAQLQTLITSNPVTINTHLIGYLIDGTTEQFLSSVNITDAEFMTYTYYDNYLISNPTNRSFSTTRYNQASSGNTNDNYYSSYVFNKPLALAPPAGKVTGTKVKIIKSPSSTLTENWINTVNFYDETGRLIQVHSSTPYSASMWDITSMQYDLTGRLLRRYQHHEHPTSTTKPTVDLYRAYSYQAGSFAFDDASQKIDSDDWMTLSQNLYDPQTGLLRTKRIGIIENQYLTYRMDGRLKGINAYYALTPSNTGGSQVSFGESISYDFGFTIPQHFGNISGIVWRSKGTVSPSRAYGYQYDVDDRLVHADFREYTDPSGNSNPTPYWNKVKTDYSEKNIAYDENGNINSLERYGVGPTGPQLVDAIGISYDNSDKNRIKRIVDGVSLSQTQGINYDFKPHPRSGGAQEMFYDGNGNIIEDANRQITIEYNFLNLPKIITPYTGGSISYSYDAFGNKLEEIYNVSGAISTRHYWGSFVYANNDLMQINNEEGYSSYDKTNNTYTHCYYVKDHLGNVRNVLKSELLPIGEEYIAEHEIASSALENMIFDNIDDVSGPKPGQTTNPADVQAAILTASDPNRTIGTSIILKVMAGDEFEFSTMAYHGSNNSTEPLNDAGLLSRIVTTLSQGVGGFEGGAEQNGISYINNLFSTQNYINSGYANMINANMNPNLPRAGLNFIFFDENRQIIREQSGFIQVGSATGVWEELSTGQTLLRAERSGYVAVFMSNANSTQVAMDAFKIKRWRGNLMEENHYYPFGTTVRVSNNNPLVNRYLYQTKGIELTHGLHLYDFHARYYDPQLGRFMNIDPAGQFASGYVGMGNNPVMGVDPDGKLVWFAPIIVAAVFGIMAGAQAGLAAGARDGKLAEYMFMGGAVGAISGGFGMAVGSISAGLYTESFMKTVVGKTVMGTQTGALNGMISGFMSGSMNASLSGGNMWAAGLRGGIGGGVSGAVIGGLNNALTVKPAKKEGDDGFYSAGVGKSKTDHATLKANAEAYNSDYYRVKEATRLVNLRVATSGNGKYAAWLKNLKILESIRADVPINQVSTTEQIGFENSNRLFVNLANNEYVYAVTDLNATKNAAVIYVSEGAMALSDKALGGFLAHELNHAYQFSVVQFNVLDIRQLHDNFEANSYRFQQMYYNLHKESYNSSLIQERIQVRGYEALYNDDYMQDFDFFYK